MAIHIITAIAKNYCIGQAGRLPWHIPEDLARFKALTTGQTVIMGRKTWESLPERFRPLPDRHNVIVTRTLDYSAPDGVEVITDLATFLTTHSGDLYVIGGGEIYRQAMDHADTLEITHVHEHVEGDTFFPPIDRSIWRETHRDDRDRFSFVSYRRMDPSRGKFIVFYGINNLGKSTQAKRLVETLVEHDHRAEYVKYPVYGLSPSGPLINSYLREGNPHGLTSREIQIMYALNRDQYEEYIIRKLEAGIHVIAEDYSGTGIAWGIGGGVDKSFLEMINSHLLPEDLVFLFDGERFLEAREGSHKHETDDNLTDQVRDVHQTLGAEHGWITINANRSIDDIAIDIWRYVEPII